MKKYITNFIAILICVVALSYAFSKGLERQIKVDCEKYSRWAEDYILYEPSQDTIDQCSKVGVTVEPKATIKIEHYRELPATVYAYNDEVAQTDEDPQTMASGKKVYDGAVACPVQLDFGTEVEILGTRYICEDRMNERYRDSWAFDIYMKSKDDAVKFGKVQTTVKIFN